MASSNNINGMKAQDWKLLDTSSIDSAVDLETKLTVEQQQLLAAIANVVKAAAVDIHGTAADDKYRYTVDLIAKRLKSIADDSNEDIDSLIEELLKTSSSTKDVESKLSDLAKQLKNVDAKSIKQCIDSVIADIKFDLKFANAIADKITTLLDKTSKNAALTEEDLKKFFDEYSKDTSSKKQETTTLKKTALTKKTLTKHTTLKKQTTKTQQSAFDTLLKSTAAKTNSKLVSKLAQLGSNLSGFIGIMQDPRIAAENIDDIVSKINEISIATNNKDESDSDDESAKAQNKKKKLLSLLMKALKSTILSPTMKMLKFISGTLLSVAKKVFGFIGKGIFAALMTPPGMYAIGFVAGYVWAKWLKPFWNNKVMPFIKGAAAIFKKVLDFFDDIGPIIDKIKKFFGIDGEPDHAGSINSLLKTGAKTAISAIGLSKIAGSVASKIIKSSTSMIGKGIGKAFDGAAKLMSKSDKIAKAAKATGKFAGKAISKTGKVANIIGKGLGIAAKGLGIVTGATPALKATKFIAKATGKAAKFGMKVLPGLGVAATFAFNKLELDALKEQAKKLCDEYKVSSLEELMQLFNLKDKDGNDITDEIHYAALNLINAVLNKIRTSKTDLALEGLDFVIPGLGTAMQVGVNKLVRNMQDADKERRAGMIQANKTTAAIVNSMREQAAMSLEIKNKINGLQNADEKQAALKERLLKLQKTKALYKNIEAQEKEAEKELEKLNSGMFSWTSSAENIKHWQDKVDSLKHQKHLLLKEQGFTANDMRDKASKHRGDADGLTEAQRLAKLIVENEIKQQGDISKEAFDMYADAFKLKGKDFSMDKDALIESKFADVKALYYSLHTVHPMQDNINSLDLTLQDRTAQQLQALLQINDSNDKLAEAILKNGNDQKTASQLILEKLGEIQLLTSRLQNSTNNNVVNVVSAPILQLNLASIEGSNEIKIL